MFDAWFYLLDLIKEYLPYIVGGVCFIVLLILDNEKEEEEGES